MKQSNMIYQVQKTRRQAEREAMMSDFGWGVSRFLIWAIYFAIVVGILQDVSVTAAMNASIYSMAAEYEGEQLKLYRQRPGETKLEEVRPGMVVVDESVELPDIRELAKLAESGKRKYLHVSAMEDSFLWSEEAENERPLQMTLDVYQGMCHYMAVSLLVTAGNLSQCSLMQAQAMVFWSILLGTMLFISLAWWRARRWEARQERYEIARMSRSRIVR